jgi:hypothetical protein
VGTDRLLAWRPTPQQRKRFQEQAARAQAWERAQVEQFRRGGPFGGPRKINSGSFAAAGRWKVVVGGSIAARQRWPARVYKSKKSAQRRRKEIMEAHDFGVQTVWILPEDD